jgi:ABC-type transporter lipoprotein component MlaA
MPDSPCPALIWREKDGVPLSRFKLPAFTGLGGLLDGAGMVEQVRQTTDTAPLL